MYTWRVIEERRKTTDERFNQVIEDHELGKSYSFLNKDVTNEFDEFMENNYPEVDKGNVRAVMVGANGDNFFLFENTELVTFTYYTISDGGSTLKRW